MATYFGVVAARAKGIFCGGTVGFTISCHVRGYLGSESIGTYPKRAIVEGYRCVVGVEFVFGVFFCGVGLYIGYVSTFTQANVFGEGPYVCNDVVGLYCGLLQGGSIDVRFHCLDSSTYS